MSDLSESDLADLRTALRSVLEDASSEDAVRATMATDHGIDLGLWATLVDGFDLPGLAVPESLGGVEAGWAAQRVVLEEMGRSLACVPAFSVVGLAIPALLAGDEDACAAFLPGILAGQLIATAALLGSDPVSACQVTAERVGDGWSLSGSVPHVLDGQVADLVLLLARHTGGLALFALETAGDGVEIQARATSDLTRRIAGLSLAGATGRLVGNPDGGAAIAAAVRPRALLALACEQTGGAQAALDQAVAYAGQRVQFGRAIGSFQAVKHKLADLLIGVEECRSATWATARALDSGEGDLEVLATATAAVCGSTYATAASGNVQVHGGIGYTWEHPAHLHVKRSRGAAALLGTTAEHRACLARLLPLLTDAQSQSPEPSVDRTRERAPEGALP